MKELTVENLPANNEPIQIIQTKEEITVIERESSNAEINRSKSQIEVKEKGASIDRNESRSPYTQSESPGQKSIISEDSVNKKSQNEARRGNKTVVNKDHRKSPSRSQSSSRSSRSRSTSFTSDGSNSRIRPVISDQPKRRKRELRRKYPRDVEVVVALPTIQSQNKKPEIHQHFYVSDEKRKRKHHKKDSQEEEEGERSGKLVKERVIIVDQDENSKFFFENDWLDGKCCVWCTSFGDTCCVFCCFPCYIYKLFHRSKVGCLTMFCPFSCCILRAHLRARYKIKGSICKDYCAMCICPWMLFSMVQMMNEIDHRGIIDAK